ncbi:MAG TPA: hypothetical protein VKU36_05720 [Candidatus Babeliales bacterium]|nr:hypothetical protein [Candidatus Babeliales bacterium]
MKKIIVILLLITYPIQSMELVNLTEKVANALVTEIEQNKNAQDELKKMGGDVIGLGKDLLQDKNILHNTNAQHDIGNVAHDALNVVQEIKNSSALKNIELISSYPQGANGFPIGNISPNNTPTISSSHTPVPTPSQTPQVPRLNLSNNILPRSKSVKLAPKTPITSNSQLRERVEQIRQSHRQQISESSSQQINNAQAKADPEIQPINNNISNSSNASLPFTVKRSALPRVLNNDAVIDMGDGKVYTVAQVWELIQSIDPVLYEFAEKNGLSLDDVGLYSNLLNEFHVHPEALIEFIKENCNVKKSNKLISLGEDKAVDDAKIKKYRKIQKEEPDKYQAIVLDVLGKAMAKQDGQSTSSPLNDTHIQTLEEQATNSESTIRYQYVALFVGAFLTLAGYAWGIYGQVTGAHTNTPTTAPTGAPIGAPTMPTFMPTGSPT